MAAGMSARETLRALVHPVRLRVAMVVAAGGRVTTSTIAAALTDVPQATVYRHVAAMIAAGVLDVVDETPVRGGVLRTLSLSRAAQQGTGADSDTLEALFSVFTATMAQAVTTTLQTGQPPPPGFGFRAEVLWLNDDDVADFSRDLRALLDRYGQRNGREARLHDLFFALAPAAAAVDAALCADSGNDATTDDERDEDAT